MNWLKKLMLVRLTTLLKTDYNAKMSKMKGKIPSITDLDNTAALNAVENIKLVI